jgi:hypothetical protein
MMRRKPLILTEVKKVILTFCIIIFTGALQLSFGQNIEFLREICNEKDLNQIDLPIISISQDKNYKLFILTPTSIIHQTSLGFKKLFALQNCANKKSQIHITSDAIWLTNLNNNDIWQISFAGKIIKRYKRAETGISFVQNNSLYFNAAGRVTDLKGKLSNVLPKNMLSKFMGISKNNGYIANFDTIIFNDNNYVKKEKQWYQVMENYNPDVQYHANLEFGNTAPRVVLPLSNNKILLCYDEIGKIFFYDLASKTSTKTSFTPSNIKVENTIIYHASIINEDKILLISNNSKAYILSQKTNAISPLPSINKLNLAIKNISELMGDCIWLGTYSGDIVVYNILTGQTTVISKQNYGKLNDIYRIQKLNDTLCGIGMSKGFCIANTKNLHIKFCNENAPKNFLENNITCFALDEQNTLWIGSYQKGLWYTNSLDIDTSKTYFSYQEMYQFVELDIRYLNIHHSKIIARCKNGIGVINCNTKQFDYFPSSLGTGSPLLNQMNYVFNNQYYCGTKGGFFTLNQFDSFNVSPTVIDAFINNKDTSFFFANTNNTFTTYSNIPLFTVYTYNYGTQDVFCVYGLDTNKPIFNNSQVIITNPPSDLMHFFAHQYNSPAKKIYTLNFKKRWYNSIYFYLLLGVCALGLIILLIRSINRNKQVKNLAVLHEINSLRSQMNPHFISNSLNSINAYILDNDSEKASDYLVMFSKLIRQILTYSSNDFITVEEEVDMLTRYINIEMLRFKSKFDYTITLDEQVDKLYKIPSMALQPFVENAIWHGILQNSDIAGVLSIQFSKLKDGVQIKIIDNGIGLNASKLLKSKTSIKNKSMGLEILKRRLDLLNLKYHTKYDFVSSEIIAEGKVKGTQIILNY